MKPIVAALLVLALPQEKVKVRILPRAPTEKAWPVGGTIDRPEDTLLQIFALRLERRWDAKIGKFRECPSPESRIWGRALVSKGEFLASLPKAPAGFYRLSVCEEGRELHAERRLLGETAGLGAAWGEPAQKLDQCRGRVAALLDLAQKISRKETAPGVAVKKDFMAAIAREDLFLEETSLQSDFTAAPSVLRGVIWQLRNAQIWGSRADDAEGKFLDPALTFPALEAKLASAKTVLWAELRASVAAVLAELLGRREEPARTPLSEVRRSASNALKAIDRAQEIDAEFRSAVVAAAGVDEKSANEVRAALEASLGGLVDRP